MSKKLSAAQTEHLQAILRDFIDKTSDKYVSGATEHGGNLWDKSGIIEMAMEEAIDLYVYLYTLKQQLIESEVKLGAED